MNKKIKNMTLAAMFLAIGMILPFFTGQIPRIGNMLLPMHIPVLLCGLICGWQYGAVVGAVLPLLRSVTLGMPPMFPTAVAMAFELMAYGFISGWMYGHSKWKCIVALYRSLITAMIGGRIVWGVVQVILLGVTGAGFTWQMFMAGAFINAVPGIIAQLLIIPAVMIALNRTGLVHFENAHAKQAVRETAETK